MTFHCAAAGCSNGSYKIKRWEQEFCDIHGCRRYNQKCSCDIGFKLLPFPTAKTNKEARAKWKSLINRQTPGQKGKLWSPSKYSRVCSEHFVDGDTTDENPCPTQKLGYDAGRKVDYMKTTSRRRKLNLTRNSETDQNVRLPKRSQLNVQQFSALSLSQMSLMQIVKMIRLR